MTPSSYFRFPHVHGDLVTFVAEDDVWIAPVGGGRAWRVSSLQLPARNPRFTPDGKRLVWTVVQGTAPEVVTANVDGGGYRQLSYFGHSSTRVKGFTPDGDVLVTSAFRQSDSRHTHAYSLPVTGGWAQELPFGPVESVAFGPVVGDERPVVLASVLSREPAWWKRYRGGAAGKLWIDADGNGEFVRLAAALDGNLTDPLWVKGRIAFLSDHEGYGNLYSVLPNGSDLRRHTDHEDFYVRHAATDGERVVFESAGELWLLPSLDAEAVKLDISLGSASQARRPAAAEALAAPRRRRPGPHRRVQRRRIPRNRPLAAAQGRPLPRPRSHPGRPGTAAPAVRRGPDRLCRRPRRRRGPVPESHCGAPGRRVCGSHQGTAARRRRPLPSTPQPASAKTPACRCRSRCPQPR